MKFLVSPRLARLALILFWLILIGAVVMAMLPKPPHTPLDRFGDKVEHITAFYVLGVVAMLAYGRAAYFRIIERLWFLGAAIETLQTIPALNRDADVRDWIVDMVAVLVATTLMRLLMASDPAQGSTNRR